MSYFNSQPDRIPPDKTLCRARKFGDFTAFAVCLSEQSKQCVYCLETGESNLCFHPACAELVSHPHPVAELVGK